MCPLLTISFTARMSPELFNKTLPYINLDKVSSSKRLDFLERGFGSAGRRLQSLGALCSIGGDIYGNPFFICTDLVHEMGTKTYTYLIVIHWTTTEYLTASLLQGITARFSRQPAFRSPARTIGKKAICIRHRGGARPDFSRRDSDAEHMSEKQIEKHVSKKEKKLKKQADRNKCPAAALP